MFLPLRAQVCPDMFDQLLERRLLYSNSYAAFLQGRCMASSKQNEVPSDMFFCVFVMATSGSAQLPVSVIRFVGRRKSSNGVTLNESRVIRLLFH